MAFMTPYDRPTIMHVLVKAKLPQKLFGIKAGFARLSRYRIQNGNATSKSTLIGSSVAVDGD